MSEKRQDLISGLILPMGQAILTGLLFALLAVSCWKLSQSINGWSVFFTALSGAAFLAWLTIWRKWQSWGDAERGITSPAPVEIIQPMETVRVTLESQPAPYLALEWLDIPLDYDQLTGVCLELLGRNFDTSNLGGAGKALTRAQAEKFRDYLIAHGLGEWLRADAHVVGWRLTGAGRAVVRRVCEIHNPGTDDAYPPVQINHVVDPRILPAAHTHTNTQSREGRWTG